MSSSYMYNNQVQLKGKLETLVHCGSWQCDHWFCIINVNVMEGTKEGWWLLHHYSILSGWMNCYLHGLYFSMVLSLPRCQDYSTCHFHRRQSLESFWFFRDFLLSLPINTISAWRRSIELPPQQISFLPNFYYFLQRSVLKLVQHVPAFVTEKNVSLSLSVYHFGSSSESHCAWAALHERFIYFLKIMNMTAHFDVVILYRTIHKNMPKTKYKSKHNKLIICNQNGHNN